MKVFPGKKVWHLARWLYSPSGNFQWSPTSEDSHTTEFLTTLGVESKWTVSHDSWWRCQTNKEMVSNIQQHFSLYHFMPCVCVFCEAGISVMFLLQEALFHRLCDFIHYVVLEIRTLFSEWTILHIISETLLNSHTIISYYDNYGYYNFYYRL